MSIIAKALKKAQEDRSKKQTKDDIVFTYTSSVPADPSPSVFNKIRIPKSIIVAMLVVLCAIVAAVIISRTLIPKADIIKNPRVISVPGVSGSAVKNDSGKQTVMEELSSKKRPRGTGILENLPDLNGIMYSVSNPQAIINDAVVSRGEIVDGFTVLEVFQNKVLMMSPGGNEFELKLR